MLDQPQMIMSLMNAAENGFQFGNKDIKSYTKDDANRKISLTVLGMIESGGDVKQFLERACGKDITKDGRLDEEKAKQFDLEWIAYEVNQWLQNLS